MSPRAICEEFSDRIAVFKLPTGGYEIKCALQAKYFNALQARLSQAGYECNQVQGDAKTRRCIAWFSPSKPPVDWQGKRENSKGSVIYYVRNLWFILLLGGCNISPSPNPSDTLFDESKRNWAEVYKHEIKMAVENEDLDAYNFFFMEYMRERTRQVREQKKKNLDK